MTEDEIEYREQIELASSAEVNECTLLCADNLTQVWTRTLDAKSIYDYCQEQYILLQQFCKAIIEGAKEYYPDYEAFIEDSYALFVQHFNDTTKEQKIADDVSEKLFFELNDRLTINLVMHKNSGPDYEVRSLAFVIYLLPAHIKKKPYFKDYMNYRSLHHYKVNTLH